MKTTTAAQSNHSPANATDLVTLTVTNRDADATDVPVCCGVCCPTALVAEPERLTVVQPDGQLIPTQADVTARWADGSAKWVLLNFVAAHLPAGASAWTVRLEPAARPLPAGDAGVCTTDAGVQIRVDEHLYNMSLLFGARTGSQHTLRFGALAEDSGPVRSVSTLTADVPGPLRCELRVSRWQASGDVRLDVTLHNPSAARHSGGLWDLGDPCSVEFASFAVRVVADAAEFGFAADGANLQWWSERDSSAELHQISSGGDNWNSSNHCDRSGTVPFSVRGFTARTPDGEISGERAQPLAAVRTGGRNLAVTVPEFWQKFPKRLQASRSGIEIGLFPKQQDTLFELQGGESTTHTIWLSATPRAVPRVTAAMPTEWIDRCQVLPWFSAQAMPDEARLQKFLSEALGEGRSWHDRREVIDEYGWRHFGDVHADHEQTHFAGSGPVVSHYNNQFDLIFGGAQHFLRTGDAEWFDFMDALARHVADIDIYRTTEDRSVYNGGLFWHTDHYVDARTATHRAYSVHNAKPGLPYGGGLSCEHNYTTGLLYHYYLTGNPRSREAVVLLADWVLNMDDGTRTIFSLVDDGPTGMASCTVTPDFHGPGRGAGNSINALVDGWLLTQRPEYLQAAEALMRRVVHPKQDLAALHLLDSEGHWSYTVCLTAVARFLHVRMEYGEPDEACTYARAVMQHYGRWMATHEKPALSEPDQLEFVTEAWAAQDFRKANVLRLCAMFEDEADRAEHMRRRADEIADRAWQDLYSFEHPWNARSISILLTDGLRDAWHRAHPPAASAPPAEHAGDFGDWEMFVSQRDRVSRMMRSPWGLVRLKLNAMHPKRWIRCWRAVRSRMGS